MAVLALRYAPRVESVNGPGARLSGKSAVILGCSAGLGRAIAEAYLAEGASVLGAGRNDPKIDGIPFFPADVRDPGAMAGAMAAATAEFGRLDVVVANAGLLGRGLIAEVPLADFTDTLQTNVTGTFLAIQAAVPELERSGGGRIITMSSVMARRPAPYAAAYAASKAAVEALTRVAALELAGRGITVNCLAPGIIDSGLGQQIMQNPVTRERFTPMMAMGRPGHTAELTAAAVFLASDESSYVNGHVMEVSGGFW
jgi:3-oxoacyl-[acyl-carrier protein] reductase